MGVKLNGHIAGEGTCPHCDHPGVWKINRAERLYFFCQRDEGGCGAGSTSTTDKSDGLYALRVTKWRDPEEQRKYLAKVPSHKMPPEPKGDPKPEAVPAPAQPQKSEFMF